MEILREGAAALGIQLTLAREEKFRRYYDEMTRWNARVNLTSITKWEEVQARHYVDSLTVSLAVPRDILESGRFVDVGSGGGFPGVPLAIAFPGLRATLIESTGKKVDFLVALKEALALPHVDILKGRAETLAHRTDLRESFDFAVARAVGSIPVLAELTLPYCRVGGRVVAQKTLGIDDELRSAETAFQVLGGRLRGIKEIEGAGDSRALVVLEKIEPTPDRYPRRPGIPTKRPL